MWEFVRICRFGSKCVILQVKVTMDRLMESCQDKTNTFSSYDSNHNTKRKYRLIQGICIF